MNTILSAPAPLARGESAALADKPACGIGDFPCERGFMTMRTAYRATGDPGSQGNTGRTGTAGENTTVIVMPLAVSVPAH